MNYECLRKDIIKKTGIYERAVNVGDTPFCEDCFNLIEREDGKWEVFYGERGQKTNLEVYDTAEEASRDLIQRIKGPVRRKGKGRPHFFARLIRKITNRRD